MRARLLAVWAMSLVAAVALGLLLMRLHGQTDALRLSRADFVATQACERIADRYAYYTTGWAGPTGGRSQLEAQTRRDLSAVLAFSLAPDVQGGIWHTGEGIVAALPSDALLTVAEHHAVDALAAQASDAAASARQNLTTDGLTELLRACPLAGPIPGLVAWARVGVGEAEPFGPLRLGIGVLFGLVLGIAAWLAWLLSSWNRKVRVVETAIARAAAPALPRLDPTGEPTLDRIVAALNATSRRLAEARADADAMARRAAQAERLAALGRVAAGVAHEIRNPLATIRLRAENALAGDAPRRQAALEAILTQVTRLDGLTGELLAMTQRRAPALECVALESFLATLASEHDGIRTQAGIARARFDPDLVRRCLENLLENARRHAGPSGAVTLSAARAGEGLRFSVADSGPGIDPALRATLMEPFVTGRADGTGLGLAIAREIAESHGGRLRLEEPGGETPGKGAVFVMEVPWCAC